MSLESVSFPLSFISTGGKKAAKLDKVTYLRFVGICALLVLVVTFPLLTYKGVVSDLTCALVTGVAGVVEILFQLLLEGNGKGEGENWSIV